MKKILLTMLGVVGMLCSTSCSDESIVQDVEGDQTVQFTVELNDGSDASRATISDGTTVSELYYEVYTNVNGEKELTAIDAKTEIKGKQATVSLALVKGQTYDIVFWAQAPGAYDASNLCSISIPGTTANNEEKDAFTAVKSLTVNGPIKETVYLYRPFAQINFGTLLTDMQNAEKAGADLTVSKIKVTNLADYYNALEEKGCVNEGEESKTVEFTEYAIPDTIQQELTVKGSEVSYEYLATAYVLFPGKASDKVTTDLTLTVPTGLNEDVVIEVPNAPAQRNYRTNVLGNLLTNSAEFTVIVDQDYDGDYPNTKEQELHFAAATGGTVTLTEDIALTKPLQVLADFVINLNGHNITNATGNAIQNKDNLTINGEGSVISTTTYGVNNYNSGVLTVNGAKINAIFNAGETTFNDGVVENTISGKHGIYHSGTKLTVNKGVFSSTSGNELIHSASSNVEINGGEFTQIGKSYLFGGQNAGIVINGGTFNGYVNENGSNDKMRPGAAVVQGGTFNFDPTQWVAKGYTATQNVDGTWIVGISVSTAEALYSIAATGGIATLTENITLTKPLQVLADFVINLNGHNITNATGNAIQNKDNLTINGEGSVISTTTYGVNNYNSGVLTVNGAKINAIFNAGETTFNDGVVENTISGKHGIYHSGTKLTVNKGVFSSTSGNELIHSASSNVEINGGEFTQIGKSYLFGGQNAGIVINGGTFNGYVNENGSNDKMRPGAAVVQGGTFNFDPTQWVAEGYTATQNVDGTWTVN